MKRFYFFSICTLGMLLFTGNCLFSQQVTPTESEDQVIIIQKIKHDDGTVTIKKKTVRKGQDAETYLNECKLKDLTGKTDILIMTDGEHQQDQRAETVFYMRHGKHDMKEHLDEMHKQLQEIRISMPNSDYLQHTAELKEKTFLGVYPETGEAGVLLTGIVSGTGAEAAGLISNDVMTAINGQSILTTGDLRRELAKYKAGDEVKIAYLRDGVAGETVATLTGKKTFNYNYNYNWNEERDPCKVFFGVYVGSYGEGLEGVGVSGIVEGGNWPAEVSGLRRGDRIIAIDAIPVNTHNELVTERDKHEPGQAFTFTILRDGYPMDIEARFKACPKDEDVKVTESAPEVIPAEPLPVEQNSNTLELEELNAYPNPTYGNLNVRFSGEAVPTVLMITDINGKIVHQENLRNFDGHYSRELDISSGTPGTLLVTVRQGESVITKPVVLLNRA